MCIQVYSASCLGSFKSSKKNKSILKRNKIIPSKSCQVPCRKASYWLPQNQGPTGATSMEEPVCCRTCAAWQGPWVLLKAAEDRDPSANRVCVELLGGHKLTLLGTWGGEGEYPEVLRECSECTALDLGFLIIEMGEGMSSFLLQMYLGWPHWWPYSCLQKVVYKSCFS